MTIKQISTNKLIPYENNPRINDGAVDAVANSIKTFGFKVPIVIDKDNVIVAGHTRLKAAEKLGIDKVPCIVADDLSEDEIKAFRLADNKTAELAEWDIGMLEVELDDIELDMSDFGFIEYDEIIPDELDAEETEEKTVVRLVFNSYSDYVINEQEIKEFAENIGATMTIGK